GRSSLGASYARSVSGGTDAVQLRGGVRLTYAWQLLARADIEIGGAVETHWGVRWIASPEVAVEVGLRWPAPALATAVRWRGDGVWIDGETTVGLDERWARVHLDTRGAIGFDDDLLAWTLRGRAFLGGVSGGAPTSEHFSVGPATGLRGTPPDTWTTPALAVASIEVAARLRESQSVLEAARVSPSGWLFVDAAWLDDAGTPRTAWAVGAGAGVDGRLLGFVPFGLGFDLGYDLTVGTWYLGWRFGPAYPEAARD
ncbi:MAG: hypothetical protein O3A02_02505, partial [bacterium]|nr:hypothetical protein [bacterium]